MIENFNLGLNSRDEMQTKHPFGENGMDYTILLLVCRDPGNHSAASYLLVGGALCHCVLSPRAEEYAMIVICFLISNIFKKQILILWYSVQRFHSCCHACSAAGIYLHFTIWISEFKMNQHYILYL